MSEEDSDWPGSRSAVITGKTMCDTAHRVCWWRGSRPTRVTPCSSCDISMCYTPFPARLLTHFDLLALTIPNLRGGACPDDLIGIQSLVPLFFGKPAWEMEARSYWKHGFFKGVKKKSHDINYRHSLVKARPAFLTLSVYNSDLTSVHTGAGLYCMWCPCFQLALADISMVLDLTEVKDFLYITNLLTATAAFIQMQIKMYLRNAVVTCLNRLWLRWYCSCFTPRGLGLQFWNQ